MQAFGPSSAASRPAEEVCPQGEIRPAPGDRLLVHMCCGPCACICLKTLLAEGWDIVGYFMNPNIQPLAEYLRRREAAEQCAAYFGIPILFDDASWDLGQWLRAVRDRDMPPERCRYCVTSRMEASFAKAAELGCTHVFSSLLYSRYQPHEAIREAGLRLASEPGAPKFLYRDFRDLWQAGIDLSIEMGLYRQPYCGCVYSEADRYAKKLARLVRQNTGVPCVPDVPLPEPGVPAPHPAKKAPEPRTGQPKAAKNAAGEPGIRQAGARKTGSARPAGERTGTAGPAEALQPAAVKSEDGTEGTVS
ncbi:MAG: epoxyqueuosine reductase QueH [Desulfovibrionaceae bacterium]|nr:epoxyqueuosine reductase QueH [Desulfovibrionaceae bacterium]